MGMTSTDAAILDSSIQAASTAAGIIAQGNINKKTRAWNEKMYAQQRADSLTDWNSQNQYNHPSQQMARLREAGLNPNLVYGKGADNTAQAVRSTDAKQWTPDAPNYQGFSNVQPMSAYFNYEAKQAQTDNLRVQNTVAAQEAILKAAQTAETASRTAKTQFDLKQAQSLSGISLETAAEELRKLQADRQYTIHQDERAAAQNAQSIKEGLERILNARSQRETDKYTRSKILQEIENLRKDEELKKLDIKLKAEGVQPTDNIFFRVLAQKWEQIKKNIPQLRTVPGFFPNSEK